MTTDDLPKALFADAPAMTPEEWARAGVPASRILSTDVVAPDDTATPESQRSATVVAELPPEVTP